MSINGVGPGGSWDGHSGRPEGLREHAEKIHATIAYGSKNPRSFEKTFLCIAVLLHLEEQNTLSPQEKDELTFLLRNLSDEFESGSLRLNELAESLEKLVEDVCYQNPKARIVAKLIEIENLLCIIPRQDQPVSFEEFHGAIGPLMQVLQERLSSIQTTTIFKDLDEVRRFILEKNPSNAEALNMLQKSCDDILSKIHRY